MIRSKFCSLSLRKFRFRIDLSGNFLTPLSEVRDNLKCVNFFSRLAQSAGNFQTACTFLLFPASSLRTTAQFLLYDLEKTLIIIRQFHHSNQFFYAKQFQRLFMYSMYLVNVLLLIFSGHHRGPQGCMSVLLLFLLPCELPDEVVEVSDMLQCNNRKFNLHLRNYMSGRQNGALK